MRVCVRVSEGGVASISDFFDDSDNDDKDETYSGGSTKSKGSSSSKKAKKAKGRPRKHPPKQRTMNSDAAERMRALIVRCTGLSLALSRASNG